MTFARLLWRSLWYYWRGNLAILLGVAVGTAVLTGALLVGDSLRYSLQQRLEQQLGWVDHALVANRLFRQGLATGFPSERVAPVLLLRASMTTPPPAERRAGPVAVFGVTDAFWTEPVPVDRSFWASSQDQAALNQDLARELGVQAGDKVTLRLQKPSTIPRESLLGRRDVADVVDAWTVTVKAVLPSAQSGAAFSMSPGAGQTLNAFLPLAALQSRLKEPERVNAMFFQGGGAGTLQAELNRRLSLEDWGLVLYSPASRAAALFDKLDRNRDGQLTPNEYRRRIAEFMLKAADANDDKTLTREEVLTWYRKQHPNLSLESRQMLLEPAAASAAQATAKELGWRTAPTLVYLANSIRDAKGSIPYSIVAALDPTQASPLGPFLPAGVEKLADNEIVLADWPESPLTAKPGETITLDYFDSEIEGRIHERSTNFVLRGRISLEGVAADPDLTPEFPGITDKLDIRDWDPPFPYENQRIQKRDEHFWEQYRTTPKAYITLTAGERLWRSRFGALTSIRLTPLPPTSETAQSSEKAAAESFTRKLLQQLRPEQGGFLIQPIRQQGLQASAGSNEFGGLFLGFSFFLIAAALLLVGLLVRLNLDRRATEIGLLLATGFARANVRRLWTAEGLLLALLGAAVGLGGAVIYGWLMLEHLRFWWPGSMERNFLRLHVGKGSLVIGYAGAVIISGLTVAWAVRVLSRVAPTALLQGETVPVTAAGLLERPSWRAWGLAIGASVLAVVLLASGGNIRDHEARAGTFFGGGMLLLVGTLSAVWIAFRLQRQLPITGHGNAAIARLGMRNAARYPSRSLLTTGLLASATFLVVAVECFHRSPEKDFLETTGGSGGFNLIASADVPLYQDVTTDVGREELNLPEAMQRALRDVTIIPLRMHAGDDVSCLNLYQPNRPRLLGVPDSLSKRGGFHFGSTLATTPEQVANPWLLLTAPQPDGAVPVFGEANAVAYVLKKKLGSELTVPDEAGNQVRLRIVGLLQDSVFQSELLMADASLLKLYPRLEGYQEFLLAVPPGQEDEVDRLLEAGLADHGMTVTPSVERLAAYLAVENTYLSTFQVLGGLGLILGAFGLAIVLMRTVLERQGELALLQALGYRQETLGWLVLTENSFLLILGLVLGTGTALVAVLPHLLEGGGSVPWLRLSGLLVLVLAAGLAAGVLAMRLALRTPLLEALRRE